MSAGKKIFAIGFVLLWAVIVALGLSRISVQNDMQVFLPHANESGNLAHSLIGHNPQARILLLAIEGQDNTALAATSQKFTAALNGMDGIAQALNGTNSSDKASVDTLFAYRYHLAPLAARYSAAAMQSYLQQAYERLSGSEGWLLADYLPQDPSGAFDALIAAWKNESQHAIPTAHGVWLNETAHHAYIIAYLQSGDFKADVYRQQLQSINTAFASAAQQGQTLLLSSPYSIALKTHDAISREAMLLSAVATTLLLIWLIFLFRSAKLIGLLMLPVFSAAAFAAACVVLIYGSIHGITLAFGITLLGLTVDYPIHVLSHPQGKTTSVMKLLLLGVVTTCIGFGAMLFSSLPGLQQLGAFILCGLLAAWGWTSVLSVPLSAGRLHLDAPKTSKHRFSWGSLCAFNLLLIAASLGFIATQNAVWNDDVTTIMPASPQLLAQDHALRQELRMANGRYFLAVRGDTSEAALSHSESMVPQLEKWQNQGEISSYDMAARYLPSQALQQHRIAALPDAAALQTNINQAVSATDFAPEAFADAASAMIRAANQPYFSRDTLPALLQARVDMLRHESGNQHIALIALSGIAEEATLQQQVDALGDADIAFIDLKSSIDEMMQGFRLQALRLCLIGCACLALILLVLLRDARKALLVLSPIAAGLCLAPAILVATGQMLTLFHLMALLLVAGVGLDYALFRYLSPPDEQRRVTRAILACAVTTLLVFAILAFSAVPALHIMGITVVLGTAYIMLWCLIFPPSRVI